MNDHFPGLAQSLQHKMSRSNQFACSSCNKTFLCVRIFSICNLLMLVINVRGNRKCNKKLQETESAIKNYRKPKVQSKMENSRTQQTLSNRNRSMTNNIKIQPIKLHT